jgi:selenocysteine lyase/cysteine desulfurase
MLLCQNHLFTIPDDVCYLNSAYMGPLSIPVQRAGAEAMTLRACPTGLRPEDFFVHADAVRANCAALVNARAEQIALVPNAANAIATVAANLKLHAGQNIVTLFEQFPSNVYPWRNFQAQGVEIRVARPPDNVPRDRAGKAWNQAILEAIDVNTAVVAVEHAHWTDGTLFDLEAIGRRAREVGAWFVIDATQTMGVLPFDVQKIQPDAMVAHSYKSMLCNYGLGFAYYGERMKNAKPLEDGWLMRAGSENFARLVDYQDEYADGMRRFDTSTRANPMLILMLKAATELLLEWRADRIRDYCNRISGKFVEDVRALGYGVADSHERAGNLFGLTAPKGIDLESLRAKLAARNIYVSVRGSAIRVSPHVYNDESDFEKLLAVLKGA